MHLFPSIRNRLRAKNNVRWMLWLVGGLAAVCILTIFVANLFAPKDRAVTTRMLGHDFLVLYYGGNCALTGHYERLYDLPATKAFEDRIVKSAGLTQAQGLGPWWNPPFAAWMFAPFAALPYRTALHAWWMVSAICLAGSIFILAGMLRGDWKTRLLVPLLVMTSMPCIQAFCHGQNTAVSLLLLTTTVWLWRKDRALVAGLVCGLLFYKPQLGVVIAAALCLNQGRRAMLGVCVTGAALVWVNVLTMPGSLHEFFYHMPANLRWIQEQNVYYWDRHMTFKAFWRFVVQGKAVGPTAAATYVLWFLSEIAVLAGLAGVVVKSMGREISSPGRDRLIAATITAMPLLMPFYFDYDLLLLSVGLVVCAADWQNQDSGKFGKNWEDRWLVRVWTVIFLVLLVWKLAFNPVVPLLAVGAALLIRRGLRSDENIAAIERPMILQTSLAA